MRMLHVITGLSAGGAERQLRLLLRHQRATAEVAALTNVGSVAREIRADGITVHEIGMRSNTDLTALPRLVKLIRDRRFDLVHTHLFRAGIYGRIAARLAGVRHIVATEHSLAGTSLEGRPATSGFERSIWRPNGWGKQPSRSPTRSPSGWLSGAFPGPGSRSFPTASMPVTTHLTPYAATGFGHNSAFLPTGSLSDRSLGSCPANVSTSCYAQQQNDRTSLC